MTRYLVTGATGFVGGHLINRFLARDAHVTAVDRRHLGNSVVLSPRALDNVDFVHLDLRDTADTGQLLKSIKPDVVYHLAAQPLSAKSNVDPLGTLQDNVVATYSLLEAVRTFRQDSKVVFTSSACFYGIPDLDPPLTETDPPSTGAYVYTATKIAADFAVQHYRDIYGLQAVCVRFVNIYGPGDAHVGRVVPRLLLSALHEAPPTLTQSVGEDILSFLYVSDAVDVLDIMATDERALARPVWNVNGSAVLSVHELMQRIYRLRGLDMGSFANVGPRRTVIRKFLDSSAISTAFNWAPGIGLSEGLELSLAWYEANLNRFVDGGRDALANAVG